MTRIHTFYIMRYIQLVRNPWSLGQMNKFRVFVQVSFLHTIFWTPIPPSKVLCLSTSSNNASQSSLMWWHKSIGHRPTSRENIIGTPPGVLHSYIVRLSLMVWENFCVERMARFDWSKKYYEKLMCMNPSGNDLNWLRFLATELRMYRHQLDFLQWPP